MTTKKPKPKTKKKRKPRRVGRPTKLTAAIQKTICEKLGEGAYIETAAAYAGVAKPSLYAWMKRGVRVLQAIEKGEEISNEDYAYAQFMNAVEKADAAGELGHFKNIATAGKESWQASAWILERKNQKRYGRKDHLDVDGTLVEETPEERKERKSEAGAKLAAIFQQVYDEHDEHASDADTDDE